MKPILLTLLRRVLLWISLLGMGASSAAVAPAQETKPIDRVVEIRTRLLAVQEKNMQDEDGATKPALIAQWPNWGNWPNWSNWNNWGNWRNW